MSDSNLGTELVEGNRDRMGDGVRIAYIYLRVAKIKNKNKKVSHLSEMLKRWTVLPLERIWFSTQTSTAAF